MKKREVWFFSPFFCICAGLPRPETNVYLQITIYCPIANNKEYIANSQVKTSSSYISHFNSLLIVPVMKLVLDSVCGQCSLCRFGLQSANEKKQQRQL